MNNEGTRNNRANVPCCLTKPPNTFAEHIRSGKVTGLKYSYKRIALQKRERAGVKQSEQPVKLLDERTFG